MIFDPNSAACGNTSTGRSFQRHTDPLILRGRADQRDRVGFTSARVRHQATRLAAHEVREIMDLRFHNHR